MLNLEMIGGTTAGCIRLTSKTTGETIQIQKEQFDAGRFPEVDLRFSKEHIMIARIHATFMYKDKCWYIRDNYSTNGTWLNDGKLQPGENYLLAEGDEIDFAHSETMVVEQIFYS